MKRTQFVILALSIFALGSARAAPDSATYTLYRNSVLDASLRLHVASFDTTEGAQYNRENCDQAQRLFQAQAAVKTKFWCEIGRFRASMPHQEAGISKQFTTGRIEPRTCSPSASELAKNGARRAAGDYSCPN